MTHITKQRPLSWSQISSFQYSPESWYKKYILNEKQEENEKMRFGKKIGERLASDPTFLPEVPRLPIFEKKLMAKMDKLYLVGFLDSFQETPTALCEYKTSSNTKKWTQKSAQEHGQILLYLYLIWVNYKIPPNEVFTRLTYIPVNETGDFSLELTKSSPIKTFEIKHTPLEVLSFMQSVKNTILEMEQFVETYPPLTPIPQAL